ncbi:TolC family protein [Mesorhizobium sangaii]|uniref:NodT family efflux transporter outer membrane factor (OMF) lipoprotein n=1 Tax=Mesorhizobium sangaii TaxID=505389 RepID=A0A841PYQ1_9HYPH|nr:TolC family protein [Mesorhizobium sangaii]MBB6413945.1 NodT family efflux transporter outer membrane factor (OMF) lipoprotein [Mesorhizobium sangaii]
MKLIRLTVPGYLVLLVGCSLSSTYHRPELPAGPRWSTATTAGAVQASADCWWQAFGDPNLDKLVGDVLGRNNKVHLAANGAYGALLEADIAAHALLPSFNSRTELLGEEAAKSSASIDVSYEIDLWRKLAAKRDNADFKAYAKSEEYEAERHLAIAGTIDAYFKIAYANQLLTSAQASLADVKQTRALVRTKMAAGAVSDLELWQAEQKVEEQAATVSARTQERLVLRNKLIVLLNGAPIPVPEPQRLPSKKLPPIQAGLPAGLLARRPDLRAAEARLRATLKDVDEIRAGFYPTISLTGGLNTSSPELLAFISDPVAMLSANAALSVLNLKDVKLKVAHSRALYEKEVLNFRSTLLKAFSEVADALGARADYAEQARRLRNALAPAQEVEQLQEAHYRSGGIGLGIWLDAQESRRAAELALAKVRLDQLLNDRSCTASWAAAPPGPDQIARAPRRRKG